nr:permease prefix domain 1-containing protein [uncultured Oscillibacter sp.]
MPERKTIAAYLEAVQGQIRWKRARPLLVRELERHLEDQRDDFLKEGKAPDEAERLAVEDMGDPVTVGTELDRVHRPRPQWGLLGLTIALAAIGVVLLVLFRQSYVQQMGIMRFLASLGLGTVAMLGMYFFDVSRLVRHARAVYIGTLAMTVLLRAVLYPTYYNALMSALYPLIYALWLYSFRGKGWKGFVLVILGGVPLAVSCEVIPSMSSLSVLLLSGLVVTLYAVGRDWFGVGRWKGLASALAIPALLLTWLLSQGYLSSLRGRLQIALHPEQDKLGRGFRGFILQAFWQDVPPLRQHGSVGAAVHAGVRVRVLTSGGQEMRPIDFSHGFLPASMAAAWGWVPLLVLLAALGGRFLWLLVKGLRQSYLPGRLVVLAVTLTLGLQTLFSAALNFGFVLFSASLPLVVGNFQTVVDMALIGLALSVFRGDSVAREEPGGPLPQRKRLRLRIEYQ